MKAPHLKLAMLIGAAALMGPAAIAPATAASPVKGGILKFVVPDEPPSFDGHKETTFALIHPDRAVLQRPHPRQSGQSGDADRFRVRPVHGNAQAGRRRQDLYLQGPQRREIP
jgi:hypothetical protein